MSDRYAVSLDELARVVERLGAFDRSLGAALHRVDAQVQALDRTWRGDAASSYASAQARWRGDLERMRAAVRHLRHMGATAHDNYAAAATANGAMWRSLR